MYTDRYIYEVKRIEAEVVDTFTSKRIDTYNSYRKIHGAGAKDSWRQ